MRIELPPASWSDPTHRAEDDAHTLTMASQPATGCSLLPGEAGLGLPLRVEVAHGDSPTLTLTF
ncbi:MAG: hypothetical protein JWP41_2852 [Ramlibacter sp.]|jgi:hypothetical protein|nr:hypothetical protein [Ramlibacter sp.]